MVGLFLSTDKNMPMDFHCVHKCKYATLQDLGETAHKTHPSILWEGARPLFFH